MKKKILISLFLAVVMILTVSVAAFADDVDVEVEVNAPEAGLVGDSVVVSGIVTVTAIDTEHSHGWGGANAESMSSAGYSVASPDGGIVSTDINWEFDSDHGWHFAEADASQVYEWQYTLALTQSGGYDITAFGAAFADWESFWWWGYWDNMDFSSVTETVVASYKPVSVATWFNNGQFEVAIGSFEVSHKGYDWDGLTIPTEIDQTGVSNGKSIEVVIPEGTTVEGTDRLLVTYNPYGSADESGSYVGTVNVEVPTNATFSNPVTVYNATTGAELLSFTEIVNGVPQ